MVGVLVSSKTLQGIPNKWPNRYPHVDQIKNIFLKNENCFNLIHYSTEDPYTLLDQLIEITERVGPVLDGFQLNITWPAPETLRRYKKIYPEKKIVLQVGGKAFNEIHHDPKYLELKIINYYLLSGHGSYLIDYLLLDPSGGLGQPFSTETARKYLNILKPQQNEIGLGVAGGLSYVTLGLLEPLVKDFPNISIDAEGRLRTKEDHLDTQIARSYIQNSLELFSLEAKCTCPKTCDCQNPPPDNWDGKEGFYATSSHCPVHFINPMPEENCPVHTEWDGKDPVAIWEPK